MQTLNKYECANEAGWLSCRNPEHTHTQFSFVVAVSVGSAQGRVNPAPISPTAEMTNNSVIYLGRPDEVSNKAPPIRNTRTKNSNKRGKQLAWMV